MSSLLAKRYKNIQAKNAAKAQKGNNLKAKQKVLDKKESNKKTVVENVTLAKEPKTLMLD